MKHLSDVCTLFAGAAAFRLSRWAMFHALSVPLQNGLCLFRLLRAAPSWACLTVGLPCIAHGEVVAFPRSAWSLNGQLRWGLNAGGSSILCRHVSDLHPVHACKHREACLRPISSGRPVALWRRV